MGIPAFPDPAPLSKRGRFFFPYNKLKDESARRQETIRLTRQTGLSRNKGDLR
jgi:hypothetical protein